MIDWWWAIVGFVGGIICSAVVWLLVSNYMNEMEYNPIPPFGIVPPCYKRVNFVWNEFVYYLFHGKTK